MIELKKVSGDDAVRILNEEESHFFDFICAKYKGEALQRKCVSFANTDGGEILVGIFDKKQKNLSGGKFERWVGFPTQEDANTAIADITNNIKPPINCISYEFIEIEGFEDLGKLLKITIDKSADVHYTASGNVFVRKGAQCLTITDDAITNLKFSKGVISFENQCVGGYDINRLITSAELAEFLTAYLPKTNPGDFLKKQNLLKFDDKELRATYAGALLYDENPSAVLPKKVALKITWYDTNNIEPDREHLKRQETIEGPLHHQILQGLKFIQQIIQAVPIMGAEGLEKARYPTEAIKEILVNALIHRDYSISDDVSILIFNNRIEIHSPGALPAYITIDNILKERFSRNPQIVRLLNKYPDRPNHDIGEGLNTAFQKMKAVRLKDPIIRATPTKVTVILAHEQLASPEEQILRYLETHSEINNTTARGITGIQSENAVKNRFKNLEKIGLIEMVPGRLGPKKAWQKKEKANNSDISTNAIKQPSLF